MQMIVQLGYTLVFALVPLTIVYLLLERYPPTRGTAFPAIHDLLTVTVAPMLSFFRGRVGPVAGHDVTPFVALISLGVGWTLIAAVLQVLS